MSSGQDTVIAVKEERARIGGVEVTKKTVIAATDEGVVAYQINTVQATDSGGNNNPRIGYPGYPQGYPGYPQGAAYPGYPQQAAYPGYPQQAAYPGYPQQAAYPGYPQLAALPAPTRLVIVDPPERDCNYHCFACDSPYNWYDFRGKGICWVLLLLLFYLILGAILVPICILLCWCGCFSSKD